MEKHFHILVLDFFLYIYIHVLFTSSSHQFTHAWKLTIIVLNGHHFRMENKNKQPYYEISYRLANAFKHGGAHFSEYGVGNAEET